MSYQTPSIAKSPKIKCKYGSNVEFILVTVGKHRKTHTWETDRFGIAESKS